MHRRRIDSLSDDQPGPYGMYESFTPPYTIPPAAFFRYEFRFLYPAPPFMPAMAGCFFKSGHFPSFSIFIP
jgi:hypothetical protein